MPLPAPSDRAQKKKPEVNQRKIFKKFRKISIDE